LRALGLGERELVAEERPLGVDDDEVIDEAFRYCTWATRR